MTYATAAPLYRAAGWHGVLPLPSGAKKNPPAGHTGNDGADPTDDDIIRWQTQHPDGNLCLRLPTDIVGVDLDLYKDSRAEAALEQLIGCRLPATVCSGSKSDGSRIAYYRVQPPPADRRWNAAPVDAVEIVQHGHRYAIVWPSTHPNGQPYRWWDQADAVWLDSPPAVDDERIAELPWDAQQALLVDRNIYDQRDAVAVGLTDGVMSRKVAAKFDEGLDAFRCHAGGRHDAAASIVAAIVRLSANGEHGAQLALDSLRNHFVDAVTPDRQSAAAAAREFDDLVAGALALVGRTESTTIDMPPPVSLGPIPLIETAAAAPGSIFVDWAELLNREPADEAERWLIEPVFAKSRGHVLYAKHKVGKSLLALWAALALATGDQPIVVIYLDYEMGEDDLQERVLDMGYEQPDVLDRLRYALLPTLPPLDTRQGGEALLAIVDAEQAAWPDHHLVVVIDTTGRALEGEENSADTIRAFYRETGIRLKQRAVTWIRLDHAGKDDSKSQRGSSAKGDDVDLVWKLAATDDGLKLTRDAARMGWVPEHVNLLRTEEPLRYTVAEGRGYPARTKECVEMLDQLGIPVEASKSVAGAAIRENGGAFRNEVVLAAIRFRRDPAARPVTVLATTSEHGQQF